MQPTPDLWLFFVLVLGVISLPGMDMAYVLTSALTNGAPGAGAAIAGIVAGGLIHMLVGATGVAAVIVLFPAAFNLLLVAGACYVAWMGIGLLRAKSSLLPAIMGDTRPVPVIFRRGLATCLLNPKAYAFVLAVYPMFLRTNARTLAMQAVAMAAITALTQAVIYGAVALAATRVASWLATRDRAGGRMMQAVGLLLIAAAALTVFEAWRPLSAMASPS